jgi:methionyl-tRNA formyltransferase
MRAMNVNEMLPLRGVQQLRFNPNLLTVPNRKVRVAVFGSFYGGYHVLRELLEPPLAERMTVVGVATDDLTQPFVHADVRLWKYPHTRAEELLVPKLAGAHDLPVYSGRVKTPEFERMFVEEWKPDLCLMATFGQMIPRHIFEVPRLGFYNFHHSDVNWPSYPGPDPIGTMLRDGKTHVVITMHEVTALLDGGAAVGRSHKVPLPPDANAVKVHRITWPQMGSFIRRQVGAILDARLDAPDDECDFLHETVVAYRIGSHREDSIAIVA